MMDLLLAGGGGASRVAGWVSAWILTYLMHSTLLLVGAWIAGRWIRSPGARDLVWKAAAVGALVTTSASLVLLRAPAMEAPHENSFVAATPLPVPLVRWSLHAGGDMAAAVWAIAALFGLCRLERGRRRFWRRVGRRGTLADPEIVSVVSRLQDAAGCTRTVYLTTSEGIGAPAAIGTAEICLPADRFAALSPLQRESVLAHELAHLIRQDPLWRVTMALLSALFLVQPLLRIARREMAECAEMACDDFAVRITGRRRPLVESLALLANGLAPAHAAAAGFGEGASPLVRRAERVLAGGGRPAGPVARLGAAAIAGTMLLTTAGIAPAVAPPSSPAATAPRFLRFTSGGAGAIDDPAAPRRLAPGTGAAPVAREHGGRLRRSFTMQRTADGRLDSRYLENGAPAEPDAAARRWITEVLDRHQLR